MKTKNSEKWVNRKWGYKGEIFSVQTGTIKLADHSIAKREVVNHPGGAAALPVFANGSVMLVRQFRIAIGGTIEELPGGRLNFGETPEQCARRELEEEVGYRAKRFLCVASFFTSPGFTNEKNTLFIASNLQKTHSRPDSGEVVDVIHLSRSEIQSGLSRGRFVDGNTIIALLAFLKMRPVF